MFKNYLKVAVRNLLKHKTYSLINISGLAVGMACVLLISLYILDELSYDAYHENADKIYRLTAAFDGESPPGWIGTPAPLAPALKEKFPEIKAHVRVDPFSFSREVLLAHGEKRFYEEGFVLADPALFTVFDFKLIKGQPETVLNTRASLVISESAAKKYFGNDNPLGKTLNYDGKLDFVISGVMEDVPLNSHFRFDFVASFEFLNEIHQRDIKNHWGMFNYYSYVLAQDSFDARQFEIKSAEYMSELTNDPTARLYLQPLADIYLRSQIARDPHHVGDITNVYLFAAIAVVILLIACINFMNLYTANSEIRTKEVGMRKVLGARKSQLIEQFLGESIVLSFLALPVAILLSEAVLPVFNQITEKSLSFNYSGNLPLYAGLLVMTTLVGLISGSYPAFILSAFVPTKMLRGKIRADKKRLGFRNVLVIFQFAVSIILIAGSFIINQQMSFVRTKKLGYDRANIVNVSIQSSETRNHYETFRNEIIQQANIIDATATSFTPSVERWREGLYFEGRTDDDNQSFFRISGDFNFADLFGMEVIAGRSFDRAIGSDLNHAYLLNETAVKEIGWMPEEAVGKSFGSVAQGRVIGVLKDFHFRSLRREMHPLAINVFPRFYQYISIKIRPGNVPDTIEFLEQKWAEVNPGIPFEYYFYDTEFDKLYKADNKLQVLFSYFTAISIFIASLGLFGLSLYIVQQRTKEIGIRKVLGASIPSVIHLVSKDLIKLVVFANLLAWPLAYLMMDQWLQDFAYRVGLSWSVFFLAGGAAFVIAIVTVTSHGLKAALANPIESLRYE